MLGVIKIGTRESELAVWQANMVKDLLTEAGHDAELVFIKSEGDIDLKTPLYEMGVQGIFTRSLDIALLNNTVDIAVHSMKDVPTQLPAGIQQAAVIKRGNYRDLFVINNEHIVSDDHFVSSLQDDNLQSFPAVPAFIATSSIRRKAQWLHRYPASTIENIRGNVNTRLHKLQASQWNGAIFAAAGLERINKRPSNSFELNWMLPAPAQGAVMIAARNEDINVLAACQKLNDQATEICTRVERDFLRKLMGGCSTPISALAVVTGSELHFRGNIFSLDGREAAFVEQRLPVLEAGELGATMAEELLHNGGSSIAQSVRDGKSN
jgi:hydroxymethylbilane synthase